MVGFVEDSDELAFGLLDRSLTIQRFHPIELIVLPISSAVARFRAIAVAKWITESLGRCSGYGWPCRGGA